MVAHHYLSALELGVVTPAVAERARVALRAAGERAFALNAFAAAARHFGKALELWPADDPERPLLELKHGRALYRGEGTGAEAFAAARDGLLAAGNDAAAAEAEIMLAELASYVGDHDSASRHLERAVELIEPGPGSWAKAFVLSRAARLELLRAKLDRRSRSAGRRSRSPRSSSSTRSACTRLNTIGTARVERNELEGLEDVERSLTLARSINSPESARGYLNSRFKTIICCSNNRTYC